MTDWNLERARALDREERVRDVDEVLPAAGPNNTPSADYQRQHPSPAHPKLDAAKTQGKRTVEDCRALAEGLNAKMKEIGDVVKSANEPHGAREKFLSALGSAGWDWAEHQAESLRHERIRHLDLADAVKEIQHYTEHTIQGLGQTEGEYKIDLEGYEKDIHSLIEKQKLSTPVYEGAVKRRTDLEAKNKEHEDNLAKVSPSERPALEALYEGVRRELEKAQYEEKTALATLQEAQRALPTIQQTRDAAALAIQSIHSMRQALLEKFVNFRFMLTRATTALKAQARIEEFLATDPAFNAMVSSISQNNVATAGATLEAWADRARKAAVDPELAQKMVEELLTNVEEARNDLLAIEGQVTKGERAELPLIREKVAVEVNHRVKEKLQAMEVEPEEEESDGKL